MLKQLPEVNHSEQLLLYRTLGTVMPTLVWLEEQTPTNPPFTTPLMHQKLEALHLAVQRFVLFRVQQLTIKPCCREKKIYVRHARL